MFAFRSQGSHLLVTDFIEIPNQKLGLCAEVGIFVGECWVCMKVIPGHNV